MVFLKVLAAGLLAGIITRPRVIEYQERVVYVPERKAPAATGLSEKKSCSPAVAIGLMVLFAACCYFFPNSDSEGKPEGEGSTKIDDGGEAP
jgi:hypothetical protein